MSESRERSSSETGPRAGAGGRRPKLLEACALRNAWPPPVWILRQAGRYLPEYRELRSRHSFVEMCKNPDLAAEVSLMPYRRFGFDAVVVFYDILFVLEEIGVPVSFEEEGPRLLRSVRSRADLESLRSAGARSPAHGRDTVCETIRRLRAQLPQEIAVIGFAGAPFTLASYLVGAESGGKRPRALGQGGEAVRRVLYEDPEFFSELLDLLSEVTARYLRAQIEGGADAAQLFDTSAGVLGREEYRRFALPFQRRILQDLEPAGVPTILYVNGCSHVLEDMAASGASALSVDWRIDLAEARRRLGRGIALQGNLDPAALFQPPHLVRRSVRAALEGMRGDSGYIFNLGAGILPETPLESVAALLEEVRSEAPGERGGSSR